MKRHLDQRVRLTVPGKRVTRTITPRQVEDYLRATGWEEVRDDSGQLPSPRYKDTPLVRIIAMIAAREGRSPGEVLRDVAAGRGPLRWLRSRKRWPRV